MSLTELGIREEIERIRLNVEKVIKGKQSAIEMVIICLLTDGHVLIEDVPGVGKTMLARSLAQSVAGDFKRIQFTNDLLPTDILGNYIFMKSTEQFVFHPGPIFTNILLADEINRGTPKVQSALLEGMEERTVSLDRNTHSLPDPFFVIATENPIEQTGTFSLPEAELDRFMVKIRIGYPSRESEMSMLQAVQVKHPINDLGPVTDKMKITAMRDAIKKVGISNEIRGYIIDLLAATRGDADVILGGSPRAAIALQRLTQGLAAFAGRDFVIPDDVKKGFNPVLRHRIKISPQARLNKMTTDDILERIIKNVRVP